MKVFISSVITGYESFRDAAGQAVETLGHEAIRAEEFPAATRSPQQACLDGVRDADLVILLLGDRYGATQASGRSATHEEFLEASRSKPLLVFHQDNVDRDEQMAAFVQEVHDWDQGRLSGAYRSPDELNRAVTRALADFAVEEQRQQINDPEVIERAVAGVVRPTHYAARPQLTVSVATGPTQALLRPAEIENRQLHDRLRQEAMFGMSPVLDPSDGAHVDIDGDRVLLSNDHNVVTMSALGDVTVAGPAPTPAGTLGLHPIIEEDILEQIHRYIAFADAALQAVDPSGRIRTVSIAAGVSGSPMGWRTRAEQQASPNSMHVSTRSTSEPVVLTPGTRPRAHLRVRATDLAEDLTVLLRRQIA